MTDWSLTGTTTVKKWQIDAMRCDVMWIKRLLQSWVKKIPLPLALSDGSWGWTALHVTQCWYCILLLPIPHHWANSPWRVEFWPTVQFHILFVMQINAERFSFHVLLITNYYHIHQNDLIHPLWSPSDAVQYEHLQRSVGSLERLHTRRRNADRAIPSRDGSPSAGDL